MTIAGIQARPHSVSGFSGTSFYSAPGIAPGGTFSAFVEVHIQGVEPPVTDEQYAGNLDGGGGWAISRAAGYPCAFKFETLGVNLLLEQEPSAATDRTFLLGLSSDGVALYATIDGAVVATQPAANPPAGVGAFGLGGDPSATRNATTDSIVFAGYAAADLGAAGWADLFAFARRQGKPLSGLPYEWRAEILNPKDEMIPAPATWSNTGTVGAPGDLTFGPAANLTFEDDPFGLYPGHVIPLSATLLQQLNNYCYVSPTGNDATANGSVQKPFATVAAAMASITTATPTSRWAIIVTGRVNDTLPIALKANVFIVGTSPHQTRVTSPAWTLDASWAPAGDHRGGFVGISVAGSGLVIDFNLGPSNEGKFYLDNAWINFASTFRRRAAGSDVNQFIFNDSRFFGAITFDGGNNNLHDNIFSGLVTVNEGPAGSNFQLDSSGNTYEADLTINYVSAAGTEVLLWSGDQVPNLTVNGPLNISATVDTVSRPTLTGGASIRYTTPDTFACIYDASGLSSGRVFTSYSNMMEYIAALTDGHVEVTLASDLNITSANDYSWSRITWLAQDVRAGATINFQGTGKIIGEPGSTDIVINLGPGVTLDCNRATPLQDGVYNYNITVGNYGVLAVSGEAAAMFDLPDGQGADVFLGYGVDCSPTTLNRQGSSSAINVFAPAGTFNTNIIAGVLTNAAGIFVAGRGYDAGWVAQQTNYAGDTYNRPAWLPFQCRETLDGNKNDYAPPYFREAENVFLDPDGVNRSISGFDTTFNVSYENAFSCVNKNVINPSATNTITLQNQNAGSAVGNRIQTQTNADIVIPARGRAVLIYDEVLGGWRAYLSNT